MDTDREGRMSVIGWCLEHDSHPDEWGLCPLGGSDCALTMCVVVPEGRVSVEAIAPIIKKEIDWGTHGIITPDCVDIALAAARMVVAWINGEAK